MEFLRIFDACEQIMSYQFYYRGYRFSLWNVFIFSVVAFALVYVFRKLTN